MVTILSNEEVKLYFNDYKQCVASVSEYAIKNGAGRTSGGNGGWWIKSHENSNEAPYVSGYDLDYVDFEGDGFDQAIHHGMNVNYDKLLVRPAIWIRL